MVKNRCLSNYQLLSIQTLVHYGKIFQQIRMSSSTKTIVLVNMSKSRKKKKQDQEKTLLQQVNEDVLMPRKEKHVMIISNWYTVMILIGISLLLLMELVPLNTLVKVLK